MNKALFWDLAKLASSWTPPPVHIQLLFLRYAHWQDASLASPTGAIALPSSYSYSCSCRRPELE